MNSEYSTTQYGTSTAKAQQVFVEWMNEHSPVLELEPTYPHSSIHPNKNSPETE